MKQSFYDFCLEHRKEHLLVQWDAAKNFPMTPRTISYGSRKQAWWVCDKGHRWQTAVQSRTAPNNQCPVCAGKQVLAGFNDLASRYPDLAAQWHPVKNGSLTPDQVLPGTHRKVWWVCGQGHQWEAVVKSRVAGAGCPVCTSRKVQPGENDLAAQYPDLAAQWDQEKNGALTPSQVLPGTRRKVWWRCTKGHSWQAAIAARTSGNTGCPVCNGKQVLPGENDLATLRPDLAAQWHPTKNLPLTPETVSGNSNRSVWWVCGLGHEWRSPIGRRAQGSTGCPVCTGRQVLPGFNDLATLEPEIAAQWDQGLNGTLTPQMVTSGSAKRVWWRCDQDHVWAAKIYSRTGSQRSGCPICTGHYKKNRYRNALEVTPEGECR